jgi:hypothetical protein
LVVPSAVLALTLSGCGGPRLGKVTGRVTVDGRPVTEGVVMFFPADGPAAVGSIRPDGSYVLTTFRNEDGAVLGKHRVSIHATRVGAGYLAAPKNIDDEIELSRKRAGTSKVLVAGAVTWLVPEKYSLPESSGLTAEVMSASNSIDFNIPKR